MSVTTFRIEPSKEKFFTPLDPSSDDFDCSLREMGTNVGKDAYENFSSKIRPFAHVAKTIAVRPIVRVDVTDGVAAAWKPEFSCAVALFCAEEFQRYYAEDMQGTAPLRVHPDVVVVNNGRTVHCDGYPVDDESSESSSSE